MKEFIVVAVFFTLVPCVVAKDHISDIEVEALQRNISKLYDAASKGSHLDAIELWKLGSFIDKFSELNKFAPLHVRAGLLKKAADNGNSEASFYYCVYSLNRLHDMQLFETYLSKSSAQGNVMGSVTVILKYAFHDKKLIDAKSVLEKIKPTIPLDKIDALDSQITISSINLLSEALEKNDLELLQKNAEKNQELELMSCLQMFADYKALINQ